MKNFDSKLIEEDSYYRVEYAEKQSLIYVHWKEHIQGEVLKNKYLSLLNVISALQPKKWLSNAKVFHYTTLQDARWVFDYFIPNVVKSSLIKYARIEAPRSLLLLDSESLLEKITRTTREQNEVFEFRFFIDEEFALDWLLYKNGE
ncbi:hypothetical protein [Pontibacter cellulosilyticus]|uniref:STAS/SEC14 domain-containing protein n=1 Tax=Pontibacter cellulosilyticus TaxID=1720253 RepID=A0A923SID0_9BACT|nr:hypothetical protein [Pontibacter cellulosilyticus]MBC5992482.1 hypothetical protein [Pontibacter cellulosilyticus]